MMQATLKLDRGRTVFKIKWNYRTGHVKTPINLDDYSLKRALPFEISAIRVKKRNEPSFYLMFICS